MGSGNGGHGILLDGSTYTTIAFPGAPGTTAIGINDLGQIVGYYRENSYDIVYHGFLATPAQKLSTDYDGDGKTDFAVWRQDTGYWYILRSSDSTVVSQQWGLASVSDVPVPGDYDGDGKTDYAVWRQDTGYWYIVRSSDNVVVSRQFGLASVSDVPVRSRY